jgi:hypothetical protein
VIRSPYARNPYAFELAGEHYRVPFRPAAVWVEAVCGGHTERVLTELMDEETGALIVHQLVSGGLDREAVRRASYALLKDAAPYPWWKTVRLLMQSTTDTVAGHMTLAGADPWSLSVAQWTATVYTLLTRHQDVKGRFKIDAELENPPPGADEDDWMSEAAFAALVANARNAPGQG